MSKQLSTLFENIQTKFQCGFTKGCSTRYCLLLMLEKWKLAVDNNKVFGTLLTDLSKAFYRLSHDLLTNCEAAFLWFIIIIFKIAK